MSKTYVEKCEEALRKTNEILDKCKDTSSMIYDLNSTYKRYYEEELEKALAEQDGISNKWSDMIS